MSEIYDLSDRAVDLRADADPLLATFTGVAGRDHRWPDMSPGGHAERRAIEQDLLDAAKAIEPTSPAEQVAQKVLIDDLELAIQAFDDQRWRRDLDSIACPVQSFLGVFDLMPHETLDEWARVLVRLETIAAPLAGYRACLEAGLAAGDVVAKRQVQAVSSEARAATGEESAFNSLNAAFAASDIDDDGLRDRVAAAVSGAQAEFVALADWLDEHYLPNARETDPVGEDRYVTEARQHLGMTIEPLEMYAWGWSEIERLWTRLGEVCEAISPGTSIPDVIELLSTDPDRAAGSVDEFLEVMQARQETALDQLAGVHFEVPEPIRRVEVKSAPPGGALAPYYTPPSEDFTRPGRVWYPLGAKKQFPLWEEVTTAHHEGFPGHHLQVGVQFAQGDKLSRYHRLIVWNPGSGEGWALYAEHLMGELGYLDPPDYEVGLLTSQLLRACRIVIDIGMHLELAIPDDAPFHPGEAWTFDLGVEMLETMTFADHEMAVSEIIRYLGWPGQAISYKIGEKVILDLRDQLVTNGDMPLKEFHSKVLEVGSVGLDLLQELVLE